jgi:hypothetical protein
MDGERDFSNDLHLYVYWKLFGKDAFDTIAEVLKDTHTCSLVLQEFSDAKKYFEKSYENNELALCHWKMIEAFEVPTVFVSEEICLLWVSAMLFLFHHIHSWVCALLFITPYVYNHTWVGRCVV